MQKKSGLLVGGSESVDRRRQVTVAELKLAKGRSAAGIDPNGITFKNSLIGGFDPAR